MPPSRRPLPPLAARLALAVLALAAPARPRRLRHLRERPGAAARALARRHAALRGQHARTTGSRSSTSARGGLTHAGSVPVGLEPVAVAARTDAEVWVVNHLSDSVSIVDVGADAAARRAHAARRRRAARHRLRRPGRQPRLHHHRAPRPELPGRPAELTTPGVGRADVWVFDATNLGAALGGTPLADRRRSSATRRARSPSSPDGSTRLRRRLPLRQPDDDAHRGRRSATAARRAGPCNVGGVTHAGRPARRRTRTSRASRSPRPGLIVKFDPATGQLGGRARPQLEQRRSRFTLPDQDVFAIDADATTPVADGELRAASARSSSTWP